MGVCAMKGDQVKSSSTLQGIAFNIGITMTCDWIITRVADVVLGVDVLRLNFRVFAARIEVRDIRHFHVPI